MALCNLTSNQVYVICQLKITRKTKTMFQPCEIIPPRRDMPTNLASLPLTTHIKVFRIAPGRVPSCQQLTLTFSDNTRLGDLYVTPSKPSPPGNRHLLSRAESQQNCKPTTYGELCEPEKASTGLQVAQIIGIVAGGCLIPAAGAGVVLANRRRKRRAGGAPATQPAMPLSNLQPNR